MKEKVNEIKKEMKERTVSYVIAAFGVVAGLAWNEAIKALIEFIFPLQKNTLVAKFVYAFILTLILVFITMHVARLFKEDSDATDTRESNQSLA